jgi:hypothetical protein
VKVRQYQPAFTRGEVSPNIQARKDLESYGKSLAKLRNAYIATQGGAYKREGTRYVATVAPGRIISFAFNTEQEYVLVFTAGQFQVFKDGILQATVTSSPVSTLTVGQVKDMKTVQSADTLLLFHRDVQPIRITRTSHTAWTAASLTFTNIPTYNYGSGAEPVISVNRGWPRCGAFYEGRLWMGGLRSRPQTLLASKVGDYFNLDKGTGLDDQAIDVTIDDDRVNAILSLFPGRTLFIMTSGGEFGIQGALGDPVAPAKIAQQLNKLTLHGSYPTAPLSVDGSVLFIERSGLVIRQLKFDFYEESYTAQEISNFSPHLIRRPVRVDVRSATDKLSANFAYFVNEDGTVAVLNIVKDQTLLAWSLFETDGFFEDVCVLNGQDVYFLVRRTINGSDVRYLERLDASLNVDCGVNASRSVLVNPDFANGLTGWSVITSGTGNVQVDSGQLRLAKAAGADNAGVEQAIVLQAIPYELFVDIGNVGPYGADVLVTIGTTAGGSDIYTGRLPVGLQGVVRFTPIAGTVYLRVSIPATYGSVGFPTTVDNLQLVASRWTGLAVLEGKMIKAIVDGKVAEDATVTAGQFDASIAGNSLQTGLMFYPVLTTLPPVISDSRGNNLVGQWARLVSTNLNLLDTQEVVLTANGKRYKPPFRRFDTDAINQLIQPYTGWKECYLGGVARDCQLTVTQDSPVGWNVLSLNVAVGV